METTLKALPIVVARQSTLEAGNPVQQLIHLYKERQRILSYHSQWLTFKERGALSNIGQWLSRASQSINLQEQAIFCLRAEKDFHVIADSRTPKFRNEYWQNLNTIMNTCRELAKFRMQA